MEKMFNCTPVPASLRSVANQDWHFVGALSELIDNSFGPGRGNAKSVAISYDTKQRRLVVFDNGRGMDAIGRLFQHGNTSGRTIGDIGEYGAGGTMALLWCAKSVRLWTLRDGQVQRTAVTWEDWFKAPSFEKLGVSDEWKKASINNTPARLLTAKHGTYIEMYLPAKRHLQIPNMIRDLSKAYATGLRKGKSITIRILKDGTLVNETKLVDPFQKLSGPHVSFDSLVVEYEGIHLPFSGRVTYSEDTTASESRVHIGYGFRNILSTNECFKSRDGSERFAGTGVSGWIDLGEGWQPYLTTTKTGIDDAPLFRGLMDHIYQKIKGLLKEAENKAFDIEFEDIALGLEAALNSHGDDFSVTTGQTTGKRKPTQGMPGQGPVRPGPEDWPDNIVPDNNPGEREHRAKPKTNLALFPAEDHQVDGALCMTQFLGGDDVAMLINRDHSIVKDAMKAKPVNKMALHIMIVSELCESITALPDRGAFVRKIFPRNVASSILEKEDPRSRARFATRQLIDRVRAPIPVPERDVA
jgi:hypothetical protein